MKNEKLITTRQLVMVLIVSMATLKVLLLPNLMGITLGRDSYIFLFLNLINDFGILVLLLMLAKKYKGASFYQILCFLGGKVFAKVVFVLLALFFFAKCCGVFLSSFVYLNENLYTTYNYFAFSVPIIVVMIFCTLHGVGSFGRVVESCLPLIALGFFVATGVGVIRADFSHLLPILEGGFEKLKLSFNFAYWFGDYMIFVIFFGKVKIEKHFFKKTLIPILISIALMVIFYTIITARYRFNTIFHTNAISDILQVQPSTSDIGSFDWVLILVWDIALFLNFLLNAFGVSFCLKTLFPKMPQVASSIVVGASVFVLNYFLKFNIYTFVNFAEGALKYFSFAVQIVLPNLIFVLSLFKGKGLNSPKKNQNKAKVNRQIKAKLKLAKQKQGGQNEVSLAK